MNPYRAALLFASMLLATGFVGTATSMLLGPRMPLVLHSLYALIFGLGLAILRGLRL